MTDQSEGRRHSPALDQFRDQLGEEFVRVSRSKRKLAAHSPRRVVVAALAFVALGAGVAVAATQTGDQIDLDQIDQTPITVIEPDGETHRDVLKNAIVVPCGDGRVSVVPVDNPASEEAKRQAQRGTEEACRKELTRPSDSARGSP
jgi:hypothetical protein